LKNYQPLEKVEDRLYFGGTVRFDTENDRLQAQFGAELIYEKFVVQKYIGYVNADVGYEAGKFTLSHFTFEKAPEAS